MPLKLFNTLTGEKEDFAPISPPNVGLYTCGPTVYNFAHIGNLRAYVFADVLRRTLEYGGYKVKQVVNITDVGEPTADESEDKMAKGLRREGKPQTLEAMRELGEFYADAFMADLKALNVELPEEMPRASAHIAEDTELIRELEQKGFAYKTKDGIYFEVAKFPAYGTRGRFKLGELKEGTRIAVNTEKKNPHDFALWKFSGTALGFESPWGRGFPGWHIECSAMSRKYLGQPFDIHTGGIDHIPVHHQNEIAQSEAAYGVPLANYWLHNEYLNMGTEKMAKSGENFITLQTLKERGIHPLAYRYYLLGAHYRSPMQFSWSALEAASHAYFKLLLAFANLSSSIVHTSSFVIPAKAGIQRILDDLDTPAVLAELWNGIREKNCATMSDCDKVLGLDIENQARFLKKEVQSVPDEIKELAAEREDARRAKDFAKSDEMREQIRAAGFEVMDTDSGPIVRKKL